MNADDAVDGGHGPMHLRAPLLWVLLPQAAGVALARFCPTGAHGLAVVAALGLAGIAFWFLRRETAGARWAWAAGILAAVALLAWSWGSLRLVPRLDEWADLPPRELTATLRVEQLFGRDSHGRYPGLARIEDPPPILARVSGQRVQFRLPGQGRGAPQEPLAEGMRLRVVGVLSALPAEAEPRSFGAYLRSREVHFELRQARVLALVEDAPAWRRHTSAARAWMSAALMAGSDIHPELRAVLPAMLLGERRLLDDSQRELFRMTGMLHLFAVSGLHVGLIALTLNSLLQLLRLGASVRAVAGLLLLLGYVLVIGAPPSAQRAYLMVLFYWGGRAFTRQGGVFPALVASAVAVLIWEPRQLFDAGAQLSYGIVAGIVLYGTPLARALRERVVPFRALPERSLRRHQRWTRVAVHYLCDYAGAAAGAFLVSVPLSLHYFGVFAPGGLLLNLLMAPLALLCVVAGCLSLLFAGLAQIPILALLGGLWMLFNRAGWLVAAIMQWTIDALSHVPGLFNAVDAAVPWQGAAMALALLTLTALLRSDAIRRKPPQLQLGWQLMPFATLVVCMALLTAAQFW